MCYVGKEVVLELKGTEYDGNRAMVVEQNDVGFLKVQVLELDKFGKMLTVSKYQLKDWVLKNTCYYLTNTGEKYEKIS